MDRRIRAATAQTMPRRFRAAAYVAGTALAVASIGAVAALGGYFPGSSEQQDDASLARTPLDLPGDACRQCGTIEKIQRLGLGGSETGLGGLAGGMTGALAGRQLGAGEGGLVLAVLGAATGAQVGSRVAHGVEKTLGWRIYVRMEDGGLRRVDQKDAPALLVGDRVRLVHGNVVARS